MTRLIGQAIDTSRAEAFQFVIYKRAEEWFECLHIASFNDITSSVLAAATPLHPITALVLPMLCTRYAQNDRSLFTFLQVRNHYHLRIFWMRLRLKRHS